MSRSHAEGPEKLTFKELLVKEAEKALRIGVRFAEDYWTEELGKIGIAHDFTKHGMPFVIYKGKTKEGRFEVSGVAEISTIDGITKAYIDLDAWVVDMVTRYVHEVEEITPESIRIWMLATVFHEYAHYIEEFFGIATYRFSTVRQEGASEDFADYMIGAIFAWINSKKPEKITEEDVQLVYEAKLKMGSDQIEQLLTKGTYDIGHDSPKTTKRTRGGHASGLIRAGWVLIGYKDRSSFISALNATKAGKTVVRPGYYQLQQILRDNGAQI
jgi:hypothetical protein